MNGAEMRKNRRYPSIAQVQIPDVFTGDAILKDLSITGCNVECTALADIHKASRYRITLFPEKSSGIGHFDLTVECVWVHPSRGFCRVGFAIMESPKGKTFQRYVDYLAWRSAPV